MFSRIARKSVNLLLGPLGLVLSRPVQDLDDFLEPGRHRDRNFRKVAATAADWLEHQTFAQQRRIFDVKREVRDFFDDYRASPFRDPHGASRIGNLLWLNLLAKAFASEVMVDSGTHSMGPRYVRCGQGS